MTSHKVIPAEWAEVSVGDVATYINGFAFKAQDWGTSGRPIIRIQNLTGSSPTINYTSADFASDYWVPPGTILVSWSATLDVFRWNGPEGVLNQHIFKVVPRMGLVEPDYLYWALKEVVREIREGAMVHGSTMKHINRNPFLSHPLLLPPLAEQRRIALRLNQLAARVRRNREMLNDISVLIHRFRESIVAAAFRGDLTADWRTENSSVSADPHNANVHGLPGSWRWITAADAVACGADIVYGIVQPGPNLTNGVPYVRGCDINRGNIDLRNLRRTSADIAARYARASLKAGDVLLGIIRATKVAIVPPELEGANITQGTARFRPSPAFSTAYLAGWLNSPYAQAWLHKHYRGIDMPGLNLRDVRLLPVPLAPADEQREIERILERAQTMINAIEDQINGSLERISQLEGAVLAKAFRGELVPQDPDDEPASVLLERIRAEKASEDLVKPRRGRRAAWA